jgi:biopolymer transport protein TolR
MTDSRRMKRMERNQRKLTGLGLNLIPMMDVLTVLVFFLLFHSFNGDIESRILLPQSVVETRPRETVVIAVSPEEVQVQGEAVIRTPELLDDRIGAVREVTERLEQLERNTVGKSTGRAAESREITLLADKTIPFKVLKKIMSTCTASGYGKISLAVIQKAAQR